MYISESKNQEKETEDGYESKTNKDRVLALSVKFLFFSSMYISEIYRINKEKETEDGDESKTDKERVLTLSIY